MQTFTPSCSHPSTAPVDSYIKAGKCKSFDDLIELSPGIKTIPCPGHTPGHTAYLVQSDGHSVLFIGDTIHCAEAQFPHPNLTILYDVDPDRARAARIKLFNDAADHDYMIAAPHISFPGMGTISKLADGYRWVPMQYQLQVK